MGCFTAQGVDTLKRAVTEGDFEVAAVYGLNLYCVSMEERRRECGWQHDVQKGVGLLSQAVSMGDNAAAADVLYLFGVYVLGEGSTVEHSHTFHNNKNHSNNNGHRDRYFLSAA